MHLFGAPCAWRRRGESFWARHDRTTRFFGQHECSPVPADIQFRSSRGSHPHSFCMYDTDRHRHVRPIIMMDGTRRGSWQIEAWMEYYAGRG
jgi:hypothetical protein